MTAPQRQNPFTAAIGACSIVGGLLGLVLAVAAYAPRSRRSSYTPAEQAAPWLSFAAGLALSFAGLALIAWLVCRAILWRDPVNTPE